MWHVVDINTGNTGSGLFTLVGTQGRGFQFHQTALTAEENVPIGGVYYGILVVGVGQ